jgi:DNA-binding NarL/FixJ family response regulator
MSTPFRVLVVDDHPAVRTGLSALLACERDLRPVGVAAGTRDALDLADELSPDVAIVDFQLGDRDGLTLCRQLRERTRPTRVVLYSAYADGPLAVAAVIAGADGVVHKSALADELCRAVRSVARGGRAIPAPSPTARAAVAARLEPDDLPILAMLLDGTDPDEIAQVLGITRGWLAARRWAMLEQLKRLPARRGVSEPAPAQPAGWLIRG